MPVLNPLKTQHRSEVFNQIANHLSFLKSSARMETIPSLQV